MPETPPEMTDAERIMAAYEKNKKYSVQLPVWSQGDIVYRSGLSASRVKKALPELVEKGELNAVKEEFTIEQNSLLYAVHGARAKATYYMTPARYEQLVKARDGRLQRPFMEEAEQNILNKYADEVREEYERLWENRENSAD